MKIGPKANKLFLQRRNQKIVKLANRILGMIVEKNAWNIFILRMKGEFWVLFYSTKHNDNTQEPDLGKLQISEKDFLPLLAWFATHNSKDKDGGLEVIQYMLRYGEIRDERGGRLRHLLDLSTDTVQMAYKYKLEFGNVDDRLEGKLALHIQIETVGAPGGCAW